MTSCAGASLPTTLGLSHPRHVTGEPAVTLSRVESPQPVYGRQERHLPGRARGGRPGCFTRMRPQRPPEKGFLESQVCFSRHAGTLPCTRAGGGWAQPYLSPHTPVPTPVGHLNTGSVPPRNTHASLTRIQLLGGRAELGILRDSVSDIRTFGRSPRGTEACCLGYAVRQVVKIEDLQEICRLS